MRRARTFLLATAITIAGPLVSARSQDANQQRLEEYCRRAAQLSPLDADAHYALAHWCNSNGFAKKATGLLEKTIAIDSDHGQARKALGYVRHGTGWILASAKPKPARTSRTDGSGADADGDSGSSVAGKIDIEKPETEDPVEEPTTVETTGLVEPDPGILDEKLAEKKEWAAAVEERMQQKLQTYETDDFLVHTTLPSLRNPKVQELIAHLKVSKKLVMSFLGVRSSKERLWPSKVQFMLLRSEQQYEQFAELVDDVDFAKNPDGAYTSGNHTVLYKPSSFLVVRRLAEDALVHLHGSAKQYSWWITEGLAEQIVVQAMLTSKQASTREKETMGRHYVFVANIIRADPTEQLLYDLLESRELRRREESRGRAMSMTFVDYLFRTKRKGFQSVLADLKGPDAPLTPSEEDEDAWKTYWLNYYAAQEKILKKHFRKSTDDLDKLWKKHVLDMARKYGGTLKPENNRRERGPNRR